MPTDVVTSDDAGDGSSVASAHPAVPLTILTGFLGAGKTTLLNRLLTGEHGRRVAVLVNDFGSMNIDAELVVGIEDSMMSLANGCVCCEIRDDLLESVESLVMMDDPPEHIVLEASGVADPAGIWATFVGSEHPEWLRLDGVICVVDSDQIFANLDEAPDLVMLKARQIGFADLVVLNKITLAGPDTVTWVRNWLNTTMDRPRLVETDYCDVPLDVLLGAVSERDGVRAPTVRDEGHHGSDHRSRFRTWTYSSDAVLDAIAFRELIRTGLPPSVYRCKGFVRLADGMSLVQVVGRRCDVTPAPDVAGQTRLVAIATDDLDTDGLEALFEGCRVA